MTVRTSQALLIEQVLWMTQTPLMLLWGASHLSQEPVLTGTPIPTVSEQARLLQAGDFVEIPPNVAHWHGATPDSEFAHIAVGLNTNLFLT